LPLPVYQADGESAAKPIAELLLTERDAEFPLENGLKPLASVKDQPSVLRADAIDCRSVGAVSGTGGPLRPPLCHRVGAALYQGSDTGRRFLQKHSGEWYRI